jgi:hypothetical protein
MAAVTPRLQRVGINLLYLVPGEVGGTEIYARELVGALAVLRPEVRFFVFAGREAAPVLGEIGWPENVSGCCPRQRSAPGSISCTASERRRRCTGAACAS